MNVTLLESIKVKNAAGTIINPATLEAVQLLVTQAGFDAKLDVALSTRLAETTFTGRVGEVQASPTANTLLGRLKDIDDAVSGTLTVAGTVTANLGTLNGAALDATLQSILTELGQKTEPANTQIVGDGGGSLTVDGTVTANQGTAAAATSAAAWPAKIIGQAGNVGVDVLTLGGVGCAAVLPVGINGLGIHQDATLAATGLALAADASAAWIMSGSAIYGYNGTSLDLLKSDTTFGLDVDVTRLPSIPAGSNKIGSIDLDSDATPGSAVPGAAQFIAGTDGTNARGLKTDTAGELQVDVLTLPAITGTVSVSGTVTVDSELPAAVALADNLANPTAPAVGAFNMGWDGTNWDRIRADNGSVFIQDGGNSLTVDAPVGTPVFVRLSDGTAAITTLPVSLASVPSHAVTNAGTFAVQADGSVAHSGADAGAPVKIGAKAIAHGTNPSAVDAADRTDLYASRHGIPFVIGGHPNVRTAVYNTTGAQTDDPVLPAIGSGTKYVITAYSVKVSAACTAAPAVRLGFGVTSIPALGASGADGVDAILDDMESVVPGSGFSQGDGSGILAVGGDGEELRITNGAPTGGRLSVRVSYYTIES